MKSYRQFIGYNDNKGDKHVIVIQLNVSKRSSKHHFKEWAIKPIVGLGEFYEKNLKT